MYGTNQQSLCNKQCKTKHSYSRITSNWWYLCLGNFEHVIEVKKNGSRWVCSKEKVDARDFKILHK